MKRVKKRESFEYFTSNGGRNTSKDDIVEHVYEPCPTTRFGVFVTHQYPLLRALLKFLPCRDLNRASKVCREWLRAAEAELAGRALVGGASWAGFMTVNPAIAFQRFADSVYYPASLCLWFSNEDLENFHLCEGGSPVTSVFSKLQQFLGIVNTPLLPVVSDVGIIGSTSDLVEIREGPVWANKLRGFASVLMIPKMQGVEVHKFHIEMQHAEKIMDTNHKEQPHWLLEKIKGPDKPIRCILIFINQCLPIEPAVIFKALQYRQEEKLVIGGAFISAFEYGDVDRDSLGIIGVAFYGNNVEASSIALTESHKSTKVIEERMRQFAHGTVKGKVNVGLMFTCCGRGLTCGRSYDRTNVDSDAFKRNFPNTSLHGIVGLGEIGCDWFPLENGKPKSKEADKEWKRSFLAQQYSSVIIHLAFGLETFKEQLQPAHVIADLVVASTLGPQGYTDTEDSQDGAAQGPCVSQDLIPGQDPGAGPSAGPDTALGASAGPDTALGPSAGPDTALGPSAPPDTALGPSVH